MFLPRMQTQTDFPGSSGVLIASQGCPTLRYFATYYQSSMDSQVIAGMQPSRPFCLSRQFSKEGCSREASPANTQNPRHGRQAWQLSSRCITCECSTHEFQHCISCCFNLPIASFWKLAAVSIMKVQNSAINTISDAVKSAQPWQGSSKNTIQESGFVKTTCAHMYQGHSRRFIPGTQSRWCSCQVTFMDHCLLLDFTAIKKQEKRSHLSRC